MTGAGVHPLLHSWRDDLSSVFVRGLAVLCGLAVLSVVAARLVTPPPSAVGAPAPQPQPDWVGVERPHPAFTLSIPEATDVAAGYAIQRHATGGGRIDVLTLGAADGAAPSLRVEIYRRARENFHFASLASEITARASALDPVQIAESSEPVDTKFGAFATATFLTAKGAPRRCLAFVRDFGDPAVQMFGWFCQGSEFGSQFGSQFGGGEFVTNATLACALDRLSLLSAGSEPKIIALFAQAELRRSFCGQRDPIMAATPKYHLLWKALATRPEPRRIGR